MYRDAQEKAGTSAHWAPIRQPMGQRRYLPFNQRGKVDGRYRYGYGDDSKKFMAALGEDGMKQLDKLYGETVESANSQLFSINPNKAM